MRRGKKFLILVRACGNTLRSAARDLYSVRTKVSRAELMPDIGAAYDADRV